MKKKKIVQRLCTYVLTGAVGRGGSDLAAVKDGRVGGHVLQTDICNL